MLTLSAMPFLVLGCQVGWQSLGSWKLTSSYLRSACLEQIPCTSEIENWRVRILGKKFHDNFLQNPAGQPLAFHRLRLLGQHKIIFLNNSRARPDKTRVLRQIAAESSPESPAISLSHKGLVQPKQGLGHIIRGSGTRCCCLRAESSNYVGVFLVSFPQQTCKFGMVNSKVWKFIFLGFFA